MVRYPKLRGITKWGEGDELRHVPHTFIYILSPNDRKFGNPIFPE